MSKSATSKLALLFYPLILLNSQVNAQVTNDQVTAAKNAIDLSIYEATKDLAVQVKEAEARKALAEAEKAEMLASIPPNDSKALAGTINAEKFGAAGLVKAFDLAKDLAKDVCASLPVAEKGKPPATVTIYDATLTAGVLSADLVEKGIRQIEKTLPERQQSLEDALANKEKGGSAALVLPVVAGTIKAAADIAALLKTNTTYTGTNFGASTRDIFVTSLVEYCPSTIKGLGTGYLGELDNTKYEDLLSRVEKLRQSRDKFSKSIDEVSKRISDIEAKIKKSKKADTTEVQVEKKRLSTAVAASTTTLKSVDAFIDSLKALQVDDKSPLYNAARFLAYRERTKGAYVLDFGLNLEGLTILREQFFTGQRLRLSGAAFLWYRVYSADGSLYSAKTVRKISKPTEVDLGGSAEKDSFWETSK